MDTTDGIVVRSPLGWRSVEAGSRGWLAPLVAAGVFGLTLLFLASVVHVPYYALSPGEAYAVGAMVEAPADKLHPPEGEVFLTTVSLGRATLSDVVVDAFRDDVELIHRSAFVAPGEDDDDLRRHNAQQMGSSQMTAIVVALRRLGYEIAEHGEGATIVQIVPGYPADGRLELGDVIVAVEGQPVQLMSQVSELLNRRQPGDEVTLTVEREGRGSLDVRVPLAADPEAGQRPVIGVLLQTRNADFELPFDVTIDSGAIGGPSAGLAFTLGVLDALSPGELTGGRKIAVTGTIEIDGRVGEVGGVAQKTAAVIDAGADIFLVPDGELAIAQQHAGDELLVIGVSTLQEALDALGGLGGDLDGLTIAAAPRR